MYRYTLLAVSILVHISYGQIVTDTLSYQSGDTTLKGIIVFDSSSRQPRPGVLVVHEWWGVNQFVIEKARSLAHMGYIAFAADMYGDSASTADPKVAMKWSSHLRGTPLLRTRARMALQQLKSHPMVQKDKIAAIGFCFGGTTVLELAYSGAAIRGVVSFHGDLTTPSTGEADGIQASILVLHGAQDPTVKHKQINGFKQSMIKADTDWQMIVYGGAKHSFTNPRADQYNIESIGYDPVAARRSWEHMHVFLDELFESGTN